MGSVQCKTKCAMHTKEGVRIGTSISHSILCALHTLVFTVYINDSITNYTYCPMNLTNKQYLFNITTTNKAGNGSNSSISVESKSSNYIY